MNRVLVTGASGFIGCSLTRHFKSLNYYVIGVTRCIEKLHNISDTGVDEWIHCDISDNQSNLEKLFNNIDYVVHLAGNAHQHGKMTYSDFFIANTKATENLAKIASKQSVKKFVFISSIKVNGDETDIKLNCSYSEESSVNPGDLYGRSKLEAENRLRSICESGSMKYVILRPPLVFGAGVKANFLSLIRIVDTNIPLPFASVKNRRSLIYVDNLVKIIERCIYCDIADNKIYLLKDISVSLPELIKNISQALGKEGILFHFPLSALTLFGMIMGKNNVIRKLLSSLEINDTRIRKELSLSPGINFDDAIKSTIDWYRGRNGIGHN